MALIDCHIHAGDLQGFKPHVVEWVRSLGGDLSPYDGEGRLDAEALEAYLEHQGVDYALVLPEYSPKSVGLVPAETVAALCQGRRRLVPLGGVNPHLHTDPLAEATRQREDLGVVGVKLHPVHQEFYPNARSLYPLYQYCEEMRLPVMVHTGSSIFPGSKLKYGDPLLMDDVASDFPGLPVILCHAGRGIWYEAAALLARIHQNVWLDISGLPPARLTTYLPGLEALAGKVLFGSDWPGVPGIRTNADAVAALGLGAEAVEAILWRNASALFGLDLEAAA
jgi:predicted TIM-barrel fold metal-dependent hydrolase